MRNVLILIQTLFSLFLLIQILIFV